MEEKKSIFSSIKSSTSSTQPITNPGIDEIKNRIENIEKIISSLKLNELQSKVEFILEKINKITTTPSILDNKKIEEFTQLQLKIEDAIKNLIKLLETKSPENLSNTLSELPDRINAISSWFSNLEKAMESYLKKTEEFSPTEYINTINELKNKFNDEVISRINDLNNAIAGITSISSEIYTIKLSIIKIQNSNDELSGKINLLTQEIDKLKKHLEQTQIDYKNIAVESFSQKEKSKIEDISRIISKIENISRIIKITQSTIDAIEKRLNKTL